MLKRCSLVVCTVLLTVGTGGGIPSWGMEIRSGKPIGVSEQPIGTGIGRWATQLVNMPLVVERFWANPKLESRLAKSLPTPSDPAAPSQSRKPEPVVTTTVDPAEQVEPSLLTFGTGNQPSPLLQALAMQPELKNLMGRFESALFMAESAQLPTQVALAGLATKSASSSPSAQPVAMLPPALQQAQQLLADWDGLMAQGKYAIARQRWQAARQALWSTLPIDRPLAPAEIRAIWLDRGTLVRAGSRQALVPIFDQMAAAGINTVFIETVNAGYPIYPSKVAPVRNPLVQGWDPLKEAVSLAHERSMTIHAWIWTFAAGNQVHNTLLNLPLTYPGPLLAAHPDWAGYDNLGNAVPLGQTKPFLDPANPEARSYLLRLISEIITNYAVDGLQLDYIRYPFQDPALGRTYGYGAAARWQFRAITGIDPVSLITPPGPNAPEAEQQGYRLMWNRWTQFRQQQVTSFVQEVSQLVRRQRPNLVLSAAVFARPEQDRLQRIQQDWGTWARQGYVDWIVLMSYAEDTNRFEQMVKPWLADSDFGSTLIIPGIRLLNLPPAETMDQILAVRDLPASGYALFAAANLNSELTGILHRTQGSTPSELSAGASNSFQIAYSRYQALQREWNLLLNNQQFAIDPVTLNHWIGEVNDLGKDLAALAQQPSAHHLQSARKRLESVRSTLNEQGVVQTASSDYRLQTWRYRLATIEHLLDHAERQRRS